MNSSAEQIGYAVGVVIGIAFFLGIAVFAVVAIVKACTKKTTGWIVVASIFGMLVLIQIPLFVYGFVRGFAEASRTPQRVEDDSGTSSSTSSRFDNSQTIRGRNIGYTIKIPAEWTIQRRYQDFDCLANHKTTYLGVIAEEANLGSPEIVAEIARGNLNKVASDVQWSDPKPVMLDGRTWLEFTVNCRVEKIPFFYQYYVYAGPEGTFQILSWTMQNLASKEGDRMIEISETFRFPK